MFSGCVFRAQRGKERTCAESSDTSDRARQSRFCSKDCAGSSTAATTRPGSRCARTTSSTTCARSATSGNLVAAAGTNGSHSHHGLGHTRWATHGGVTERNAHPLTGCEPGRVAIVLNGIIENYMELRDQLTERGHTFTSETDAEVVVHLLEEEYDGDLAQALGARLPAARGPLLDRRHPPRPARPARRRPAPDAARRGPRRRRELPRLVDRRLPQRDAHRHPPARRRGRRDHARRRPVLRRRRRDRDARARRRSTGTRRAPRRAATRRSCSRRSSSSRRPWPRRSATASAATSSCSRRSG